MNIGDVLTIKYRLVHGYEHRVEGKYQVYVDGIKHTGERILDAGMNCTTIVKIELKNPVECLYLGWSMMYIGSRDIDEYGSSYFVQKNSIKVAKVQPIDRSGRFRKPFYTTLETMIGSTYRSFRCVAEDDWSHHDHNVEVILEYGVWVVCDKFGKQHDLPRQNFPTPEKAIDAYYEWSEDNDKHFITTLERRKIKWYL